MTTRQVKGIWDWREEKRKLDKAILHDFEKTMNEIPARKRTSIKITRIKIQCGKRFGVSLMTVYRILKRANCGQVKPDREIEGKS